MLCAGEIGVFRCGQKKPESCVIATNSQEGGLLHEI